MNKIGDSYLPCIAMAHSPQVVIGFKNKLKGQQQQRQWTILGMKTLINKY
jgi:hypothetical protein